MHHAWAGGNAVSDTVIGVDVDLVVSVLSWLHCDCHGARLSFSDS